MDLSQLQPELHETLQRLLGYLNFSSGAPDPQFLAGLNEIFAKLDGFGDRAATQPNSMSGRKLAVWKQVVAVLQKKLNELSNSSSAFGDSAQAKRVLRLIDEHFVDDYMEHHRDLMFHQRPEDLFNGLMVGRSFEALLANMADESLDDKAVVAASIRKLNDFVGHRPIPTLESRDIEPHLHEWVRPVPVYVEGAGVTPGRYHDIIKPTLEMLRGTDEDLLRVAYFEPEALIELAFDPRAYDFDHPVNRRPNYHFGEWDPHNIDNRGNYRRFVVRQVALEALIDRIDSAEDDQREEMIIESAAVLSGTILMASGISGSAPDSHDSNTSLVTLLPRIAAYRDQFYEQLLSKMSGDHGQRLRDEQVALKQPFGSARQHLNQYLAQRRASQIQHVRLAKVFARIGYPSAARRQSDAVPVASARMQCRIDCAVTAGHQAIVKHERSATVKHLERIVDQIKRGIACGAIVDPWNIIGFQANFSLFPAMENTVRDYRIDELVGLVDRVIDLYSRLWSDAAAADDKPIGAQVEVMFEEFANWWNQFAAHEVSTVKASNALAEFKAARDVSAALDEWHRGGAAAGDVKFWAPHVESFDSPKAYALVVKTLLEHQDFISAMSLLVHWLNQAPRVALEDRECSFHTLAESWVRAVVRLGLASNDSGDDAEKDGGKAESPLPENYSPWMLLRKFFDYLEANADEYWMVPKFRLHENDTPNDSKGNDKNKEVAGEEEVDDDDDAFAAAYEGVIFRDSTDDGMEGSVFDSSPTGDAEIEHESERIVDRLAFLGGLARLWSTAATAIGVCMQTETGSCLMDREAMRQSLLDWHHRSASTRRGLLRLVDVISEEKLYRQGGDHDAMLEYDRRRLMKESLIEQIIAACTQTSEAERFLVATLLMIDDDADMFHELQATTEKVDSIEQQLFLASRILTAIMKRDRDEIESRCEELFSAIKDEHILYVPLSKSGVPREIAFVRMRQRLIEDLLVGLPRMGMLQQTLQLLDTARRMERNIPAGRGAVTQFDELFEVGFREMVFALVRATASEHGFEGDDDRDAETLLVYYLEQLTEAALDSWLKHSRTLRLSVLERVRRDPEWTKLVEFIKKYGSDLFTQKFLMLGNVRAILHCGSENWLADQERFAEDPPLRIVEALGAELSHVEAADMLNLILEAVVENYHEYRDYNSTTTQSDRGEMLYTMLDFIRVRVAYDRVAWNLRPVVVAHEVLVRQGRNEAAQLWRRMLAERIGVEANRYQQRLVKLQKDYAMRMASVAERIGERFLVPMTIDRMRALVKPAVEQVGQPGPHHAFEILEEESDLLMRNPVGSGVEAPSWLVALEQEIATLQDRRYDRPGRDHDESMIEPVRLSIDQIEEQFERLRERDQK